MEGGAGLGPSCSGQPAEVPDTEVQPSGVFQFQVRSQLNTAAHVTPCGQKNPLSYIIVRNKSLSQATKFRVVYKIQRSHIYSAQINYLGDFKNIREDTGK